MNIICIVVQLILSFHIFNTQQVDTLTSYSVVGGLLIHLIFYLIYHVTEGKRIKSFFAMVDGMTLVLISLFISNFWILVAAVSVEVTSKFGRKAVIMSISLLIMVLLLLEPKVLMEEGALYILTILGLYIVLEYENKLLGIKKTNEELREKLYKANRKIEYIQKEIDQIEEITKIQERNVLVQKLHDKIGHTLAANIMQLEAIKIILHKNKEEALSMLDTTIQNLRTGMDDIRNTLRSIKPEQSEIGISQIRQMLDTLTLEHKIETELSFEGDISAIGMNIWHVISQNLQEAITNMLKHSTADRLSVRIEVYNKIIKVQFKDNGEPIKSYEKGLGLMGMEERAQSIKGRLMIHTDNGFEILMVVERVN